MRSRLKGSTGAGRLRQKRRNVPHSYRFQAFLSCADACFVIDKIMSRAAADLPEDPTELRRFAAALAAEVHAKTLLIEKLKMQLAILRRARFGRSSEKLNRDIEQLELLIGDIKESDAGQQARARASDSGALSTPPKKPSVRAPLPDHLALETIVHDAPCVRRHSQHPRAAPRSRTAADHPHAGRPEAAARPSR